jgi:prolipoprotein diacylglyceryl transferase
VSAVGALLAAIPSPSSGDISLGPLRFTAYGLMIALGVIAAVEIARRRGPARGIDADDLTAIATWAVPAGLIGARLYHVITDWPRFEGRWFDAVKIWQGGLGIPGGIIAGVLVGLWAARRRGVDLPDALDVVAPALPVAQAIGRWGNWWNQEVFGRPTTLPWGLEIDPENRPDRYSTATTFHPAFLYECLWNLALAGALVAVDRRHRLRPGQLFALYVLGYGVGRLWVEALRSDAASLIGPFRVNIWFSLLAILGGGIGFVVAGRRSTGGDVAVGGVGAGDVGAGDVGAVGVGPGAAGGSHGELVEDGIGEAGPALDGPGPEIEVGQHGAGEPGDRVDPEEGAGTPEVPERSN